MDSLLEIIDGKLLPWAQDRERQCIIWTGSSARKDDLPEGARLTQRSPRGPRRIVKTKKVEAYNPLTAQWPRDGLIESGVSTLVCVYAGRADYWAGDNVVHCQAGHFLLLPPGICLPSGETPHYDHDPRASRQFCDLLWFQIVGRVLHCWICHSQGAVHTSGLDMNFLSEAANTMLELMIGEGEAGKPGWQSVCQHYLSALLSVLRRDLVADDFVAPIDMSQGDVRASRNDPIERAKVYIGHNLGDSLTIDAVAHRAGMSRSQFIRKFQNRTGQTFLQYVTERRIDEAKELLINSDWEVQRIATVVGLRSASYFSQLFSASVGTAPLAFRRQNTRANGYQGKITKKGTNSTNKKRIQ